MKTSSGEKFLDIITVVLASAAVFLLALHKGQPKPFDLVFAILFLLTLARWETWKLLAELWSKIKPYALYFLLVFLFIVLGILTNFKANIEHGEAAAAAMNLARIVLNAAVFLFFAFLVSSSEKLFNSGGRRKILYWLSVAFLFSFALAIPAYSDFGPDKYISGSRLKAFSQGPLQLGLLSTVGFLLAMGLLLEAKKLWQKLALFTLIVGVANANLWAASRATWIAIAISLATFFVFSPKALSVKWRYFLALPALAFFLGWLFLPNPQELAVQSFVSAKVEQFVSSPLEDQSQLRSWSLIPQAVLENPLGYGFKHKYFSYGTLFEVTIFGGMGALLFFVALIVRFLKQGLEALRELASGFSYLYSAWVIAGIATLIVIFFTDGFFWRQTWALLGISLGAIWSAIKKGNSNAGSFTLKNEDSGS